MTRTKLSVLLCMLPVATFVSACSLQSSGSTDRRYDDLRGLVLEQRRAIEDLRREQETVRAAIDQLQYGNRRALGRPVYGPAGGADDTSWQRPTPPAVDAAGNPLPVTGSEIPGQPVVATTPNAPVPTAEPEKTGVPSDLVGSSYDSAMRQLEAGDQDEAIQSFRNYLHENGSSAYADDAQFWIGESYFRKGQYHRAIIEFNQVSINYGSGDKAPSALLRQAEAFRIVGDRVDARLSLQKIINRYPGTGEAAKASRMLTEIGG